MEIEQFKRYMRVAGYSPRTIEAYVRCITEIGDQDLMVFLDRMARSNKSAFTLNQYHSAYKLYSTKILDISGSITFSYTKRPSKLPVVLTREEIGAIIESTKNSKHKLLIALAYGAGLRVSEVVSLQVKDIDLAELTLTVRSGKGDKDRLSIVPESIVNDLRNLMAGKTGDNYLFESERGGRLTTRTAQTVFMRSLQKTGISKPATFHSLRHSFATHLLENGVSIRYIQQLLGHASITTTQLYTKVTNPQLKNIKSPL